MRRKAKHGTRSGYARHRRLGEEPCARCRAAQREGVREANERQRARWLAAGKSSWDASPRKSVYDERALALMRKYGMRPDPRFMPEGR